jgi:hypothetical protein
MSMQQEPQCKVSKQQEAINGIIHIQSKHTNEITSLMAIINKQQKIIEDRDTAMNGLVDNILYVQKQANHLQNMQKELIILVKQKMDTHKCIELNSIIEKHQLKQMETHQTSIQNITTQLSKFAINHKEVSSLNKKVNILQKKHTEHSENLKGKIDVRKCIELNTNIGRQQQKQMKEHQNDIQHLTTQISDLVTNQNQVSSLTQANIDNQTCIKITQAKQQTLQEKVQKSEEQMDNKITELTVQMNNIQYNTKLTIQANNPLHTQNVTTSNDTLHPQTTSHISEEQTNDKNNKSNTLILIEDIKSTLNSDATAHAFCNQFQIPQICLADSQTSWTDNNTLKISMKNSKIAETVRRAIAFQMRLKIIKQGYTTNMFRRCHMPRKFYTTYNENRIWLPPINKDKQIEVGCCTPILKKE